MLPVKLLILISCTGRVFSARGAHKVVQVPEYLPNQSKPPADAVIQEDIEEPQPEPYQLEYAEKYPPQRPYQYQRAPSYCDSREAPICARNLTSSFCLVDAEYPNEDVQAALAEDYMLARQYVDEKDQSADDLVERLGKSVENTIDYSHYKGDGYSKGNWVGGQGYVCPSQVEYGRPLRARNIEGLWRVVVNDPSHCTQTQRLEVCLYEDVPCRTLAACYKSRCVQKYVHHRILSFDPCNAERGIFFDVYKLPSACSCLLTPSGCKNC